MGFEDILKIKKQEEKEPIIQEDRECTKDEAEFERRFDCAFAIDNERTGGEHLVLYDLYLDRYKDKEKAQRPVFIAHGFTEGPRTQRELAWNLVKDGYRVIMFDDPEGATWAVAFAMEHPELVESMVLTNPAGMMGEDSSKELLVRALEEKRQEKDILAADPEQKVISNLTAEERNKNLYGSVPFGMIKQIWESYQTLKTLSDTQIHSHLKRLIEESSIPITIVHGGKDRLFPIDRVKQQAADTGVQFVEASEADHAAILRSPQLSQKYVVEVLGGMIETHDTEIKDVA